MSFFCFVGFFSHLLENIFAGADLSRWQTKHCHLPFPPCHLNLRTPMIIKTIKIIITALKIRVMPIEKKRSVRRYDLLIFTPIAGFQRHSLTCAQCSDVAVTAGHFFIVVEYRHDNEYVAVGDDRHWQNESQHQHVDVEQTVGQGLCRVVPRTRRLKALQHVLGPAENRRHGYRQAVYPHEHADLKIE